MLVGVTDGARGVLSANTVSDARGLDVSISITAVAEPGTTDVVSIVEVRGEGAAVGEGVARRPRVDVGEGVGSVNSAGIGVVE